MMEADGGGVGDDAAAGGDDGVIQDIDQLLLGSSLCSFSFLFVIIMMMHQLHIIVWNLK